MPTVRTLCNLARQSLKAGSHDRAVGLARHILRHYSKCIEAHSVLGEVSADRGDIGEAGRYFKLVLSADPENVTALIGLGVSYREQGSLEGALVEFERALEMQPENIRLRREVLRITSLQDDVPRERIKPTRALLGRIYLRSGLYDRAAKELKLVFEEDQTRLDAGVALAEAFWRAELFGEASQVCRAVLRLAPDCLKPQLLLADMCFTGAISGDGRAISADARILDPDNRMADILFFGTPSASRWARRSVELPLPDESELAAQLMEWGEEEDETPVREEQVEAKVEEAIREPEAAADGVKGVSSEAESMTARVLRDADAHLVVARLRSTLVIHPDDHVSRLSLALALGSLGQIEEACGEFERLVVVPEMVRQVILGLKEILAAGVDRPDVHRVLADAYMKDGAFTEAIEQYALAQEREAR